MRDHSARLIGRQWQMPLLGWMALAIACASTSYGQSARWLELDSHNRSIAQAIRAESDAESKSADEAFALARQAAELANSGKDEEAIATWEQVLTWAERHLGAWHQQTAAVLSTIAGLYRNLGQYHKAEMFYSRALAICEKTLGPYHSDTGLALNNLGLIYGEQGKYSKAMTLYSRALVVVEKALGPEHPETAAIISNLAGRYQDTGQYSKAESLYARALAIRNKAHGPDSLEAAKILNNIAQLYAYQGRYTEAESIHIQALKIRENKLGSDHSDIGTSLNNLASLYSSQGLYEKAGPLYMRALSIKEQALGAYHPDTLRALSNLASHYSEMSYYGKAIPLLIRAIAGSEKSLGLEHPDTGAQLNNLGLLYANQGLYHEAEPLFLRALAISEKALGPDHPDTGLALNNLAFLYSKQEKYEEAERLYARSLSISQARMGPEHPETANRLDNLAGLYHDQGLYDQAERLYTQALSIKQKRLGPSHPEVATSMNRIGVLYGEKGEYKKAEPLHVQSLAIRQSVFGADHLYTADAVQVLAAHYSLAGKYMKAIVTLERYLGLELKWLMRELPLIPERSRTSQLKVLGNAWEASFGWIRKEKNAKDIALQTRLNRQGLLAEIEQRQRLLSNATGEDKDKIERLQTLTQRLSSVSLLADQRNDLRAERDQLQRLLYSRFPDLKIHPVTTKEIAAVLPADAALVEFQRYRPFDGSKKAGQRWGPAEYIALILKPDNSVTATNLGVAANIDGLIARAISASAQDQADAKLLWEQLSGQLLTPILPELRHSRQWFLSPDAELNRVPFAALPAPSESNKTLAEAVDLRLLTTGRELIRLQKVIPTVNQSIVIANPRYGHKSKDRSDSFSLGQASIPQQRSPQKGSTLWPALPGSEQEGRQVASILSTSLISGAAASSSTLQSIESPRILHIATHGFFVAEIDDDPSDPLRVVQDGTPQLSAFRQENPQLRSGLVLAGANNPDADPADDGYLTAAEAVMLNLKGTELVVLSACSTGQGDIRSGEGVYGLQRALTVAGARSTLLSLWKVDDEATAEFMERFYTRLKEGEGRSDALAATQRDFRDGAAGNGQWKDPYYWAAWQLVGDWRPIKGL